MSGWNTKLSEIEHQVMYLKSQALIEAQDPVNTMGSGSMYAGTQKEYQDLLSWNHKLMMMYDELSKKHTELLAEPPAKISAQDASADAAGMKAGAVAAVAGGNTSGKAAACLGVIRLDYDYPPAKGDIDHPGSFGYDVYYRVVPGLTFEMCQSGIMSSLVEKNFKEAVDWLVAKGVSGITGDCGFMMYFQQLARRTAKIPVFMSSLSSLPAITCGFSFHEKIAIFTANSKTLAPMRNLIKSECGVDPEEKRFLIVGCENVPGFEAVALGGKVDVDKVTPGMVQLAKEMMKDHPEVRAILLECTELPPYADALRAALKIPVWDAITSCDFFITGMQDNVRFGLNNWQQSWDGQQAAYHFGANLTGKEKAMLVNKLHVM